MYIFSLEKGLMGGFIALPEGTELNLWGVGDTVNTLNNVNSSVHHRILKENKVTWSNCTAARSTLPYTFCLTKSKCGD